MLVHYDRFAARLRAPHAAPSHRPISPIAGAGQEPYLAAQDACVRARGAERAKRRNVAHLRLDQAFRRPLGPGSHAAKAAQMGAHQTTILGVFDMPGRYTFKWYR